MSDAIKRCAVQFGVGRHLYTDNKVTRRPAASRPAEPAQNGPQRPAAPRPVSQPTPARTEPPRASTAPVQSIQPMGTQQALDVLAEKGFNRKAISDAGKELFGTGYMKDLDGHQRAQLVAHLIGGGSAVPAEPPPSPPADDEDWAGLLDQAPAA